MHEVSIPFLGEDFSTTHAGKDLAVILDFALPHDEHITKLASASMFKLFQIYLVKDCFTKVTLKLCIIKLESLVLNKLFYSTSVWGNTCDSNIKNYNWSKISLLEFLQVHESSITLRHIYRNWHVYLYIDLLLTFKCLNDMAPSYLSSSFSVRSSVHGCNTRNQNDLQIPFFRTSATKELLNFEQQNFGTI